MTRLGGVLRWLRRAVGRCVTTIAWALHGVGERVYGPRDFATALRARVSREACSRCGGVHVAIDCIAERPLPASEDPLGP